MKNQLSQQGLLNFYLLIHMTHLVVPLIRLEIMHRYPEKMSQTFHAFRYNQWGNQKAVFFLNRFSE